MMRLADFAVIGGGALTAAIRLRRAGWSVETQFSGSRKKQYRRAHDRAINVIDLDNPEDCEFVERLLCD